jgi:hypothetical protein
MELVQDVKLPLEMEALRRELAIEKQKNADLTEQLQDYDQLRKSISGNTNKLMPTTLLHSKQSFFLLKKRATTEDESTKAQLKRNEFALAVSTAGFPSIIDPRDTVASLFLRPRYCNYVFHFYKQYQPGLVISLAAAEILALIGVTGIYPELGYGAVGILPITILFVLHMNRTMLKALLQSFEFWSLFVLVCVFAAGLIDAVYYSINWAPRVFVIVIYVIAMISTSCTDAKIPQKRRNYALAVSLFFASSVPWALTILWWTGTFVDISQNVIKVGVISIDFQSMSMSSLVTYAVLMTKYCLVAASSPDANPLLVVRPKASYRFYEDTSTAISSSLSKPENQPCTSDGEHGTVEMDTIV